MAIAKPLHFRLFLEGEEVPVIAAQVSININGPSAASIQIIPLDEAMDLRPRTMVHLLYLDEEAGVESVEIRVRGNSFKVRGSYRILFPGEAIGISIVRNAAARSMVLQCVDFSSYWDSAHATAIEYGPNGNALANLAYLYSADTYLFDDIVNQQSNVLVSLIGQSPSSPGLTSVKGLAGGVIKIMEAMSGVRKTHRGVNDFFTVAELRCRLLQQITAEENDNTAKRLLSSKVFDEWIRNGLQNIGQQVTFRDMMLLLFQYIYYDFVPNPTAKFDTFVEGQTKTVTGKATKLSQTTKGLSALSDLREALDKLTNIISYETKRVVDRAKIALELCAKATTKLKEQKTISPKLAQDIAKVQAVIDRAVTILKPIVKSPTTSPSVFDSAKSVLAKAIETLISASRTTTEQFKTSSSTAQRLRTQIIRPDCWFAAPPKCNVIFPEQYTQLSYDRNWMSECTRMLVQVYNTLVGKEALLSEKVLAPSIGMATTSLGKRNGTGSYRVLMDHELHTGIIPQTGWMPNTMAIGTRASGEEKSKAKKSRLDWAQKSALFKFFKARFASRQASISGRFNPFVVCGFPGVIIQAPLIIPPNLISEIENQDIVNNIYDVAGAAGVKIPYQLVGLITGITHSVSQEGGTTSVSMSHVRRHTGTDDEFLGLYFEQTKTVNRTIKVTLTKAQAAKSPEILRFLINATPQGAIPKDRKITKKKHSTNSASVPRAQVDPQTGTVPTSTSTSTINSVSETSETQVTAPPLTAYSDISAIDREDVLIPSPPGDEVKVGERRGWFGGEIVAIEVLNNGQFSESGGERFFDAITVYEKVPVSRPGPLPFEDVVRPSWFSPAYTNENITKQIYDPFFGCGSVVDDLIVEGVAPVGLEFYGEAASPEDVPATMGKPELIKKLADEEALRGTASVDRAITVLSYLYGKVKQQGLDVDEFIRSYIDRPIATKEEILGSDDLRISVSGSQMTVESGTLGFHSTAVDTNLVTSPTKLVGLLDTPEEQLHRVNGQGEAAAIPPSYDVRGSKKERVLQYVIALEKGPAFRG